MREARWLSPEVVCGSVGIHSQELPVWLPSASGCPKEAGGEVASLGPSTAAGLAFIVSTISSSVFGEKFGCVR